MSKLALCPKNDRFCHLRQSRHDGEEGENATKRLQSLAGAKILELEGGHPCYLDSPDAFVDAILEDLGNYN
jgi:hypothetical protein